MTLSLIARESARVMWPETYEGEPDDVFGLVDRAADRADVGLRLAIDVKRSKKGSSTHNR